MTLDHLRIRLASTKCFPAREIGNGDDDLDTLLSVAY